MGRNYRGHNYNRFLNSVASTTLAVAADRFLDCGLPDRPASLGMEAMTI